MEYDEIFRTPSVVLKRRMVFETDKAYEMRTGWHRALDLIFKEKMPLPDAATEVGRPHGYLWRMVSQHDSMSHAQAFALTTWLCINNCTHYTFITTITGKAPTTKQRNLLEEYTKSYLRAHSKAKTEAIGRQLSFFKSMEYDVYE